MPHAIGLDIYGTLVDPLAIDEHLRPLVGERAESLSELWRAKQLEYTFRRGLMKKYADFGVCTRQALDFAAKSSGVEFSDDEKAKLMERYQDLRTFPDVVPGLEKMKERRHRLVAFSNGVEATARTLLEQAGVLSRLEAVISVDDVKSFKPDPAVYEYLARRCERPLDEVWLVSGNPFDVIGAKSVGMKAAWVKRRKKTVFDPWGVEPDLIVSDLEHLAEELG